MVKIRAAHIMFSGLQSLLPFWRIDVPKRTHRPWGVSIVFQIKHGMLIVAIGAIDGTIGLNPMARRRNHASLLYLRRMICRVVPRK